MADIDRYCQRYCLFQTLLTNELVLWVLPGGWAMRMRSSGPRLLVGHNVGHCIMSVVTGIDCGRLQSVLCRQYLEFSSLSPRIENHVISRVLPGRPTGRRCCSKHRASRSVGCTQVTAPFIHVSLFHAAIKLDPLNHPRRPTLFVRCRTLPCEPSLPS
jgi:hypothetical protein